MAAHPSPFHNAASAGCRDYLHRRIDPRSLEGAQDSVGHCQRSPVTGPIPEKACPVPRPSHAAATRATIRELSAAFARPVPKPPHAFTVGNAISAVSWGKHHNKRP
jgi:hypothetical protein